MSKVGIVGFGEIGSRMGKRLVQRGYSVTAYDIDAQAMNRAKAIGALCATSPAEVAQCSEFIIVCVTDPDAVEKCVIGENGIVEGLQSNSIVIETTTSKPSTTRKIAVEIERKNGSIIDAPVSRGVPAAENGTLSILVGGKEEVLDRCRPLLECLGTDIIHVGDLGAGHCVKAINMMMLGCNLIAASEVITLGVKAGIEMETMLEVINVSSGESYMTSNHFLKYVLPDTFDSQFSLGLMLKDIKIGTEIAYESGLAPIAASKAKEIYRWAASHNMRQEDNMRIVQFIQRWMGGYHDRKRV
ncbi:2-hydroxy-3-oxopropionate reductase [Bacillus carboniphilus]|uniref:2-hydroxy-3-oxopropionate reductase n=1 Tax=Bacillus carboniphilus TaxID=86663 RepID=A0ABN0W661_9BACI